MTQRGIIGDASSAGVYAREGAPASEHARRACAELGFELTRHSARQLTPSIMRGRVVLCMSEAHARAARNLCAYDDVFTLSEYAGARGDIQDPYGGDIDAYRACAREIDALITKILNNGGMRA